MTPARLRAPVVVLVTDPRWPLARVEEVIALAGSVLAPHAFAVQLRDKVAAPPELARTAERLRRATSDVRATFLVNAGAPEALRIASAVGADGAHVPCRVEAIEEARTLLGPHTLVSTPAHTDDDVATARAAGASCVLVSPIFATPGKGAPRGPGALTSARAHAGDVVVIALGGVDVDSVAACATAGAQGVAVIRALLDAPDPAATAYALGSAFDAGGGFHGRGNLASGAGGV